jgi:opacity protein-like surface antigen
MMLLFCLTVLNAQDEVNIVVQQTDSLDLTKNDSILLKRINPEDMFRNKKLVTIDSSDFDSKEVQKRLKTAHSDYRRWRFGLNGGFELIIAPEPAHTPEELLKYKKSLKSGPRFGVDAVFYISPNIGAGINYSTFSSNNKTNYISYETNGNTYEGARQDDIRIHFIGPAISIRSIPKHNKFYAFCDFTIGYFTYSNNLILKDVTHNLKRQNFGFATSVGADIMFVKNMSLGVSLNITAASIRDMEILSGNNIENLSRISLVVTLKMYK